MQSPKRIPLYRPPINKETSKALIKCFESGWWGYGEECKKLEDRFNNQFGGWSLATSSCTSALYIIARLLFQNNNNEVIIPAINWVSSALAFLEVGFKVKIADVAAANLMANLETIKPLISDKTTAIVIVHLYGQRANIEDLSEYCRINNITLIEDCAHRVDFNENPLSDYKCYSFNTFKEIPCGEGGLIWSKQVEMEKKARLISYLGMETNTMARSSEAKHKKLSFSAVTGLKLQLNDLSASIANSMFEFKETNRQKRKKIFENYDREFMMLIPKVKMIERQPNDSYLIYVIIIDTGIDREQVRDKMALDGVSTSIHYQSLSEHPLIKCTGTPVADHYSEKILTLPCYPGLGRDDQFFITQSFKTRLLEVWKNTL